MTRKANLFKSKPNQLNLKQEMAAIDPSLNTVKEKTFIYAKFAFAMAVDEKLPKTQSTLIDENLMIKMGLKPVKVMCQRISYGGVQSRIVAETRFTAQTVLNGIQMGNSFLKALVVRDLNHLYGVDAVAGGKLYTRLSSTKDDDSYMSSTQNSQKLPGKKKVHEMIDDTREPDRTSDVPASNSSRTPSPPCKPATPPPRSRRSSCSSSSASTSSGTTVSIVVEPRSPQPIGRYINTDAFDYYDQMAIGKDDDDEIMDGQFYIEENTFCNNANQEIFDDDEELWTNQSFIVENRFVTGDPNPQWTNQSFIVENRLVTGDPNPHNWKKGHNEHAFMKSILSPQEMMPPNKKKKPRFFTLGTP